MKRLLLTALIAASLGFLLASPASATPCKDKATTTTTVKPTTTTTVRKAVPCTHQPNTQTTKPSAPTTIAPTTTTSVKSVPAGVTTTTTVPEDDSLTATDYNLPSGTSSGTNTPEPVGTPETPVQLASAVTVTRDTEVTELAQTGLRAVDLAFIGFILVFMGVVVLEIRNHRRDNRDKTLEQAGE